MATGSSFEEFALWKKDRLQAFLRDRGIPCTGKKDELVAIAYGAYYFNIPVKLSAKQEEKSKADRYRSLLTIGSITLPDPLSDLGTGWIGEAKGMTMWPPTMYGDLAEYLVDNSERDLRTRLLTDYKEGKAFSYFDSKWLKEVWYHPVSKDSLHCFLKAQCCPSMNISNLPHDVWVCIEKASGRIASGYCSCFAGLGGSCNHVAAVLFKLDFAWQKGYTNKACTSVPATWTAPSKTKSKNITEPKLLTEMEWHKPHYKKHGQKKPTNPAVRRLFSPTQARDKSASLESLMSSLFVGSRDACVFQYVSYDLKPSYPPEDDINVHDEFEVTTCDSVPPPVAELIKNHDELPVFSAGGIASLEEATRHQSQNETWHEQRIGRITSSTAHKILVTARKLQRGVDPVNLPNTVDTILGHKTVDPDLPALKYGRAMEPEARKAYEISMVKKGHKNLCVVECGLFVHPELCFFGASPDGIVSCDCCGKGLLEIKCPISIAHLDPLQSPPAYLIPDICDNLTLKETHEYFTQIAMHLLVTGLDWCDLFVYTSHGHFNQRFEKQAVSARLDELKLACSRVFIEHIRPALVSSCETDGESRRTHTDAAEDHKISHITGDGPKDQQDERSEHTDTQDDSKEKHISSRSESVAGEIFVDHNYYHNSESSSVKQQSQRDNSASQDASTSGLLPPKRAKRSRRVVKMKPAHVGPTYLCGICNLVCKDDAVIIHSDDNSVGCDKCYTWYHWGCVGYDGTGQDDWFCAKCTQCDD